MLYCDQLRSLKATLVRKRPSLVKRKRVIFLHDNAPLHTVQTTKDLVGEFGWKIMSHPPHSPDQAPSDYH